MEYIDIILIAMIAGFIFLRLRNILGRKTGHQSRLYNKFKNPILKKVETRWVAQSFRAWAEWQPSCRGLFETVFDRESGLGRLDRAFLFLQGLASDQSRSLVWSEIPLGYLVWSPECAAQVWREILWSCSVAGNGCRHDQDTCCPLAFLASCSLSIPDQVLQLFRGRGTDAAKLRTTAEVLHGY